MRKIVSHPKLCPPIEHQEKHNPAHHADQDQSIQIGLSLLLCDQESKPFSICSWASRVIVAYGIASSRAKGMGSPVTSQMP